MKMQCLGHNSNLLPISTIDDLALSDGSSRGKSESKVFSLTDLSEGLLTFNHQLNSVMVNVNVFKPTSDGIYETVIPNRVIIKTHTMIVVDLKYFPVTSGWVVWVSTI